MIIEIDVTLLGMEDESLFLGENITLLQGSLDVDNDVQVLLEIEGTAT
jgi:hypothetical protein